MKYYRISHSVGKDTGRKFPQVKTAVGDFNVNSPYYIGSPEYYFKEIDINPQLPELVLWDSSVLTDLVSSSFMGTGSGLIIRDKLKLIIEKYQPIRVQFFKIKIHHKGKAYDDYWYLHPSCTDNNLIDFPSSDIWELTNLVKTNKCVIQDELVFEQQVKNAKYPQSFYINHYNLKSELPNFFVLTYIKGGIGYFISEVVRREIEEANCTGIEFKVPNEEYP